MNANALHCLWLAVELNSETMTLEKSRTEYTIGYVQLVQSFFQFSFLLFFFFQFATNQFYSIHVHQCYLSIHFWGMNLFALLKCWQISNSNNNNNNSNKNVCMKQVIDLLFFSAKYCRLMELDNQSIFECSVNVKV